VGKQLAQARFFRFGGARRESRGAGSAAFLAYPGRWGQLAAQPS
jgi:hypothetical protein